MRSDKLPLGYLVLILLLALVTTCVATSCASPCGPTPEPRAQATGGPESLFALLFGHRGPVCVPENHRVLVPSAGGWQEVCPCEEPAGGMQTITLTVPRGTVEMSKEADEPSE